jgi:two-component system, chemotaxis family, protein-glutamate methylesterase/glutaminase
MVSRKIRVVIVDDSLLIRRILREILSADPAIEVVGEAGDPYEAREKIKELNPDVITLDIEMPKMNGIDFLEKIMKLRPMPVVMISTLTQAGADITVRALEIGAVDTIGKPTSNQAAELDCIADVLIAKIKAAALSKPKLSSKYTATETVSVLKYAPRIAGAKKLIAIGASTGGVEAIRVVLERLPLSTPPVLVTQHMPDSFIPSFAARMNTNCAIEVVLAQDDMPLQQGHAYVAAGGCHLGIKRRGDKYVCKMITGDLISGHRPSVDAMFTSVAEVAGSDAVGVILTGMGADGARGLKKMLDAGARTIGQNESSCVVYGMPKMAKQAGGVQEEHAITHIAERILSHC